MRSAKLLVAVLIPIIFISMAAYSYAHFTDSLLKKYRVHVKCFWCDIISYKAVSRYDDDLITKYPPDDVLSAMGGTLSISLSTDKAFPGWYVWVGLLIQNKGGFPAIVNAPTYSISDPAGVGVYTEEYYYGPFAKADFKEAWGKVRWQDLEVYGPPSGNVPPPVILEPNGGSYKDKAVLWIYLELLNGADEFQVHIEISVLTESMTSMLIIDQPDEPFPPF
jgi:hypothetical protein